MIFTNTNEYIIANNTIISYLGKGKKIRVPAIIQGVEIKRIGDGAFYGLDCVEEIIVDEGILEIGSKAFGNCPKLQIVQLPESVEIIEDDIFYKDKITNLDFYMEVPYSKYISVREGSIKLSDGRYLFDPMSMGERIGNLICEFMPGRVNGKFRIDRNMRFLFAQSKDFKTERVHIEVMQFDECCNEYAYYVSGCCDTETAIFKLIKSGATDIWFDHSEEDEDFRSSRYSMFIVPTCAVLFFVKEGSIGDDSIKLNFKLSSEEYFFERLNKVNIDGNDYYICQREYLTGDTNMPYLRDIGRYKVYSVADGKICEARDEEAKRVISKYLFVSELI